MNVLLLKYSVGSGGIMSWLLTHAEGLRRLGVDCRFWFCHGGTRFREFEGVGATLGTPQQLTRALQAGSYDVVHIVNDDPLRDLVPLIRPVPKLIVTSHGRLAEWRAAECFGYTAVSRSMARLNQPLTDLEVEMIPNAVDWQHFSPPTTVSSERPIIAWAGRTTDEQKGFPRFTRIAAFLAKQGFRFWVADAHGASWNSFRTNPACREFTAERWERVAYQEMPQFYRDVAASGGLLLMTSAGEGFGLVAVEAAASGLSTIGPAVMGIEDTILSGATGLLYRADASDAEVANQVAQWIAASSPWQKIEACVEFVRQEFSIEAMSRRYVDVYNRTEQRLRREEPVPWKTNEPGMRELLERFHPSRWQRAQMLRNVARQLAVDDKAVALRALYRSARIRPRCCARPAIAAHVLKTSAMIAMRWSPARATTHATGGAG